MSSCRLQSVKRMMEECLSTLFITFLRFDSLSVSATKKHSGSVGCQDFWLCNNPSVSLHWTHGPYSIRPTRLKVTAASNLESDK